MILVLDSINVLWEFTITKQLNKNLKIVQTLVTLKPLSLPMR